MGIRDELQTEVAAAFDTDLQDSVKAFTGSYTVRGAWDPVTETGTEALVTYEGRGVLAHYKLRRIDGVNILHGDVKITALVNEVTDKPAIGHIITAPDPITGKLQCYHILTASADSAGAAYSIQLRRA
ncbi:TPA: glutamate 5-kinase [Klebsiella aerogenes]|uniref:hypothetical protein n=1 Tax=Klebsiella aerogenes TaxID=548 RepID=UPI000667EDDC|nr:hypothetical protein [Klebsiella aerogenes]AMQ62482.1 glutamate 5-kinase [Klebsiella aerogenes]AVE99977.1 glutamate 5-kinase [Klebsiella aerogenes]EKY0563652.1 glutamate 5-kinase [Klebsiella aerogenes]ELD8587393.1 glutamate 5-kinase [Klebsiella aerogenes]ELI9009136.1 glutamate 5-kinase [Klebsiella aerogenes]